MTDKKAFRVCKDRTGDELRSFYGITVGYRPITQRDAIQKVIHSDIDFAFKSKKTYPVTRFGNGTWPVLYTAKDHTTALCEVSHHARKEWRCVLNKSKRKTPKYKLAKKILYTVNVSCLNQLEVATGPDVTHPSKYGHCHTIAENALAKGFKSLDAPSARNKGGRCFPIFDSMSVKVDVGLDNSFTIRWFPKEDTIFYGTIEAKSKRELFIWQS